MSTLVTDAQAAFAVNRVRGGGVEVVAWGADLETRLNFRHAAWMLVRSITVPKVLKILHDDGWIAEVATSSIAGIGIFFQHRDVPASLEPDHVEEWLHA